MTAEGEKHQRLFDEAQDRARRAQAQAALSAGVASPMASPAALRPANVSQTSYNTSPSPNLPLHPPLLLRHSHSKTSWLRLNL